MAGGVALKTSKQFGSPTNTGTGASAEVTPTL